MRFVPVKTAEQQAALMLVGVRDRAPSTWEGLGGLTPVG
jgi:hypothetical protein